MSKQCYGSCFDVMNLFLCKHIKIKHDVLQLCSRESIQLVNRVKISLIMNTFLRIANSIESLKLYFFLKTLFLNNQALKSKTKLNYSAEYLILPSCSYERH